MPNYNKIAIIGHLGRDPELKYTPNGDPVCSFSVATSEKVKDEEFTTWFNVNVWGKSAEACNTYLHKGSAVYVEGRLRQRSYNDKEGNARTSLDVRANEVQFLGSKGDSEPSASAAAVAAQAPAKQAAKPVAKKEITDDDIPF